jgi:hypothetical protein
MSLIGSMRSNKLKLKKYQDEEQMPLTEQINDFIALRGDEFIMPYLDIYDRDRMAQGKNNQAH